MFHFQRSETCWDQVLWLIQTNTPLLQLQHHYVCKWFIVLCQLLNNCTPFNIWTWEQEFLIICPVCSSHDCMHSCRAMKLHSLLAAHSMHIGLLPLNSSCFFRIHPGSTGSQSFREMHSIASLQSVKSSCRGVRFKLSCETSDSRVRITLSVSSSSQHEIIHNPC